MAEEKTYQHALVQALAEFWTEWLPKMEQGIDAMPPIQRLFYRQVAGYLDISMVLRMLDSSPETVDLIREKLLKVIEAEEVEPDMDTGPGTSNLGEATHYTAPVATEIRESPEKATHTDKPEEPPEVELGPEGDAQEPEAMIEIDPLRVADPSESQPEPPTPEPEATQEPTPGKRRKGKRG